MFLVPGALTAGLAFAADLLPGAQEGFGALQWLLLAGGASVCAIGLSPRVVRAQLCALWVSVLLMLVMLEGGVRLALGASLERLYEFDEQLLHAPVRGAEHMFVRREVNGGGWVRTEINGLGLRGAPLRSPPGQPRVVVYGDSFIMGEYSPREETFVAQLQALLGKRAEVLNAGVSAYGPDQALRRMEGTLSTLAADHVVFSVYVGNDLGDLVRNGLYRTGKGGALEARRLDLQALRREARPLWFGLRLPALIDRIRRAGQAQAAPAPQDRAGQIQLVEDWYAKGLEAWARYAAPDPFVPTDLTTDHYDADVALEPDSPRARAKLALLGAVAARASELARERGVALTFMVIPSAIDVESAYDGGRVDAAAHPQYRPDNLSRLATQQLAATGRAVVNLYPVFKEAGGELYLRGGNDHWSARGQALAARAVAPSVGRPVD